jgi:hypothetical protein
VESYIPPTVLCQILDLRLLIARAGERDSLAWWDSHALTEQGQWALRRLYPRYAAYAGARLAMEAATILHSKALGQRPAVTLFSLGADLDARVMRQLDLRRMDDEPLDIPLPIRSLDELQARLSQVVELTDDDLKKARTAVNGHLVESGEVTEADVWSAGELGTITRRLAVAYLHADDKRLVVPYFRLVGGAL